MIPQLATIRYQNSPHKQHRLWIPLLPIYLILSPLLPFVLITLVIACARYRINPIRLLIALTRMFATLGGFQVDIHQATTTVTVKLT